MPMRINPLPAEPKLNEAQVEKEIEVRKARVEEIMRDYETDPDSVGAKELGEMRRLNNDMEKLVELKKTNNILEDHPGHPMPPGGWDTPDSSPSAKTRGFKAGYWAQPFRRQTKDTITPSGSITVPSLLGGIIQDSQPTNLLDVIPRSTVGGTDTYAFLRETVRTHAAAPVLSSGTVLATKPVSTYDIEKVDARVETIAHLTNPVRRQMLADAALLQDYLEGALREGLQLALENQIINGDGVAPELLGLVETPGINTAVTFSSDLLTTSRKAITALEAVNVGGGVFVFSPALWEEIELLTSADGPSLFPGPPVDRAQRRLWGKRVITTTASIPADTAFLVDFNGSTMLYEREGVRIDWSENTFDSVADAGDFARNLVRWRAEMRVGFSVLRPAAVIMFETAA